MTGDRATAFLVDPDALDEARATLLGLGGLLVDVRLGVVRVTGSAGEWATDGALPEAVADLLATLDEAAGRCQDDVVALTDALWRGAQDYRAVDNGLTVRRSATVARS